MEKLKGSKTVTVVYFPHNTNDYLDVQFNGLSLRIFCNKKLYRRSYDKWYVLSDHRSVYNLRSVVGGVLPEHDPNFDTNGLRLACELEVDIPALLPSFVEFKYHQIVMTHAYLDIVTGRLMRIRHGLPP